MPSSSRRKGKGREKGVQRKRRITIIAERRAEIDTHYLARALLRLAQEQYDTDQAEESIPGDTDHFRPDEP